MTELKDMPEKVYIGGPAIIIDNGMEVRMCFSGDVKSFEASCAYIRADLAERGWKPIREAKKIEGKNYLLLVNGEPILGGWACWRGHGGIEAEGWNNTHQNFPTGILEPTDYMELLPPPKDEADDERKT